MASVARRARKPKAVASVVPAAPAAWIDPGWISKPADMAARWDGVGPSWVERETAHLIGRIDAYQDSGSAMPEAERRLFRDARLMLDGMLAIAEQLRR